MQEPGGFQRMVSVSLLLHGLAIAIVLVGPRNWLAHEEPKRSVMTIALGGGGGAGPQAGGLTSIGGRSIQQATAQEERPRREAVRAPAAKAPEMTLPVKGAKATKTSPTAVKQAPDAARGRTPTKGAEVRAGSAVAETGSRGQGFGLSTGGSPGSGSSLDVADFCCPDYLSIMLERIRSSWDQSAAATGSVIVKFTIQRDGPITDESLEKGSGYTDLDLAARRAVQITHQIPPLPQAFPNPTLTVHLNFKYQQ